MTDRAMDTHADAWEASREHGHRLTAWTDRAVTLAAQAAATPPPGRIARWLRRRAAARAQRTVTSQATVAQRSGGRLRYNPPIAALDNAALLQVAAMTDLVGTRVAAVITDHGARRPSRLGLRGPARCSVSPSRPASKAAPPTWLTCTTGTLWPATPRCCCGSA